MHVTIGARRQRIAITSLLVLSACAPVVESLPAQTEYYDLEAGHPLRVDDATTAARNSWALELPTIRADRYSTGDWKFREDARLDAGLLPFTELEIRVPLVQSLRAGRAVWALAGIGAGFTRQVHVESPGFPALAVGGEALIPLGGLAPPKAAWSAHTTATRTFAAGRVNMTASVGTFSYRVPPAACVAGTPGCPVNTQPQPPPPDVPCLCGTALRDLDIASTTASAALVTQGTVSTGYHSLFGVGYDHSFPFKSILVGGDVFVEKYSRLYSKLDASAELGARWQATPTIVLDAGLASHFAGTIRSVGAVLGASYSFSFGPT